MTEQEKFSEGFLERWSRKKIEADRDAPAPAPIDSGAAEAPASSAAPRPDESKAPAPAPAEIEFDLTKLPSLDTITAATDIRGFLAPGVPKDIARAALRRAWAADPAIRDFKGLAENDWDFTDPAAMPGFGPLPAGTDVKKLVAQIFGEGESPADPGGVAPQPGAPASEIVQQSQPPALTQAELPAPEDGNSSATESSAEPVQLAKNDFVQRDNNIASQQSNSDDEREHSNERRQHGGALPSIESEP